MTREDFETSDANRVHLATLLSDPVLQGALTLLAAEMDPSESVEVASNPQLASSYYHRWIGANRILKGLKSLTHPSKRSAPVTGRRLEVEPT